MFFIDPGETDLLVTDESGRQTGVLSDGTIVNDIPLSFYADADGQPIVVVLSPDTGKYEATVRGKTGGEYEIASALVVDGQVAMSQSFVGTVRAGENRIFAALVDPEVGSLVTVPVGDAGDANLDGLFNQFDLIQVLQAAKYNTGQAATWSEGDWTNDRLFDQFDVIAALQTGTYLQGANAALHPEHYVPTITQLASNDRSRGFNVTTEFKEEIVDFVLADAVL